MGCRGAQSERGSGVRRLLLAQARQCRSGAQCAGSAPAVGGPVGRGDTGPPLVVGGHRRRRGGVVAATRGAAPGGAGGGATVAGQRTVVRADPASTHPPLHQPPGDRLGGAGDPVPGRVSAAGGHRPSAGEQRASRSDTGGGGRGDRGAAGDRVCAARSPPEPGKPVGCPAGGGGRHHLRRHRRLVEGPDRHCAARPGGVVHQLAAVCSGGGGGRWIAAQPIGLPGRARWRPACPPSPPWTLC